MSHSANHPREHVGCQTCGTGPNTWEPERELPQIGQTFTCSNCGREVFAYDVGGTHENRLQWRDLTQSMKTNLSFYDLVGDWPDAVLHEIYAEGVERQAAIDYHAVEEEGLTQREWAARRDVAQPTVSKNINEARAELEWDDGEEDSDEDDDGPGGMEGAIGGGVS